MNNDSEKHLESILKSLLTLTRSKYEAGNREHGGDLSEKSTLELLMEIRGEAIDTLVYTQTAIQNEIRRLTTTDKEGLK